MDSSQNDFLNTEEIYYLALGETTRIGASSHYLRLGRWGIILDTGIDPCHQGEEALPRFELLKEHPVNAIIISHAHLDHLGALPVALRYFPQARIYMTPPTAVLSEILLFHYLRVQNRKAEEQWEPYVPLYSEAEVENLLYLFQTFKYNFPFRIHGFQESNIEITFWDAGHILGSAGIEIQWRGRKIFYTGNTKKSSQFILKGARYPRQTDILITETTYGADCRASRIKKSNEVKRFVQFLSEHIRLGGSILIPVFALGRTQEILMLLHQLIMKNRLPAVPIYITGLGKEINRIYDRQLHKVYPEYDWKRLQTITYNLLRGRRFQKPAIILATSGMMIPRTLSYEIAAEFLTERRNGIALVGWADPETPGGALREKKIEEIKIIFGVDQILCGIEMFYFSAHSHREELLSMIEQLRPGKIILCHGELEAQLWIRSAIENRFLKSKIILPKSFHFIKL